MSNVVYDQMAAGVQGLTEECHDCNLFHNKLLLTV